MTRALAGCADVRCRVEHADHEWIVAVLRKRAGRELSGR
jgi:hypothetical protein